MAVNGYAHFIFYVGSSIRISFTGMILVFLIVTAMVYWQDIKHINYSNESAAHTRRFLQ